MALLAALLAAAVPGVMPGVNRAMNVCARESAKVPPLRRFNPSLAHSLI